MVRGRVIRGRAFVRRLALTALLTVVVQVVVAQAVVALGGATPTAYAERFAAQDAMDDVMAVDQNSEDVSPAPGISEIDIARVVVRHRRHRLVVTAKVPALQNTADVLDLQAKIVTPATRFWPTMFNFPGENANLLFYTEHGAANCRRAELTRDLTRGVLRMSIPRACIGRPRWVRVGVTVTCQYGSTLYSDDALRGRANPLSEPRLTSRLRRG